MFRIVIKNRKKTIVFVSVITVFLAVFLAAFLIFRDSINKPKTLLKALQDNVDLQIKGFVYTEVGENKGKWEVKAESASYDKKQNLAVLDQVRVTVITADGKKYEMKADKGRIFTDKKNMNISGNVVITSDDGDNFFTEYVQYSDEERKFFTDAPVRMESRRIRITGQGLAIFLNSGELSIPSMVKANIH